MLTTAEAGPGLKLGVQYSLPTQPTGIPILEPAGVTEQELRLNSGTLSFGLLH